jgi:hypothetical protein
MEEFCLSVAVKPMSLSQLTPRYAILTRRYVASGESRLSAMLHSAKSRFLALYCIERSHDSVLCCIA